MKNLLLSIIIVILAIINNFIIIYKKRNNLYDSLYIKASEFTIALFTFFSYIFIKNDYMRNISFIIFCTIHLIVYIFINIFDFIEFNKTGKSFFIFMIFFWIVLIILHVGF